MCITSVFQSTVLTVLTVHELSNFGIIRLRNYLYTRTAGAAGPLVLESGGCFFVLLYFTT